MASNFAKRIERLEEAYASVLRRPLAWRFLSLAPHCTVADIEPQCAACSSDGGPVRNEVMQTETPTEERLPTDEPTRPKGFDTPSPRSGCILI